MRPERAHRIVRRAIEVALRGDAYPLYNARAAVEHLLKKAQRWDENDQRTGEETYGYESEESIYSNLGYISDRFNCGFRLRWILDGIDGRKF